MKIAVIGGGVSGMFVTTILMRKFLENKPDKNWEIVLFEKNNRLGKKLLLTGNGKCNFTNGDFENLDDIYNNDFLHKIYNRFNNKEFMYYMESMGVVPKCEIHKGIKYYYPNSNKSNSVYYNLLDSINNNINDRVKISYNTEVADIKKDGENFVIFTKDKKYSFDKVVIATGGMTYKKTGSSGDGYKFAKSFGHTIIKPLPALTGLKCNDKDMEKLKGARCDGKVILTIAGNDIDLDKKKIVEITGEIQWTEYGISGIPIMNMSGKILRALDSGKKISIEIDFTNDIKIFEFLQDRKKVLYYKNSQDFLCGFIPDELAVIILRRAVNDLNKKEKVINLTYEDLKKISEVLQHFKVNIKNEYNYENAQVTTGGVNVYEIDDETCESKLCKGLYFIGEVIDVDGICGGYNLQECFSTAMAVATKLTEECNGCGYK